MCLFMHMQNCTHTQICAYMSMHMGNEIYVYTHMGNEMYAYTHGK